MALEDAGGEVDRAISGATKGLAYENPFAGVASFLRRPYAKDVAGADLAISGIPFDQGVTHRPGARFGPRAIREASTLMAGDVPYGWGYSPNLVRKKSNLSSSHYKANTARRSIHKG